MTEQAANATCLVAVIHGKSTLRCALLHAYGADALLLGEDFFVARRIEAVNVQDVVVLLAVAQTAVLAVASSDCAPVMLAANLRRTKRLPVSLLLPMRMTQPLHFSVSVAVRGVTRESLVLHDKVRSVERKPTLPSAVVAHTKSETRLR